MNFLRRTAEEDPSDRSTTRPVSDRPRHRPELKRRAREPSLTLFVAARADRKNACGCIVGRALLIQQKFINFTRLR